MFDYRPEVLIADDDPQLCTLVAHRLRSWGYSTSIAGSAAELWTALETTPPNAILLDVMLGDANGAELVPALRERLPETPIIVVTGHGCIETAVQSLRAGAFDYICKPLDFERLRIELGKAIEQNRLQLRVRDLETPTQPCEFCGMLGCSTEMARVFRLIECVAPTDVAVLIEGETGTGKELAARALHARSNRARGPFVAVNCAAMPRELIESALFGHVKGSFTGAHDNHAGYCEQADGGTLFLDEISEMDFDLQSKLLRFLQDHVVQRVGGRSGREVDVRVIAATNRDPQMEIEAHRLREDLYFRLNVVSLLLPPLRERDGDVPLLTHHFLERSALKHGRPLKRTSVAALRKLEAYEWPGNVRELQHLVEQLVVTCKAETLDAPMLPKHVLDATPHRLSSHGNGNGNGNGKNGAGVELPTLAQMERRLIQQALHLANGMVPDAARRLAISEATVYRKIKKYGLWRPQN